MKILGMGMPELLIILAVILLIFGPKNLPKLGGAIGKTVKNLREGMNGSKGNVAEAEEADAEEAEVEAETEKVLEEPAKKTAKKTVKKTAAKKTVKKKAAPKAAEEAETV